MGKKVKAKKRGKTVLEFDETARVNYITGFHKRKQVRRKIAKVEQEAKEKAELKEKRRLLREAKKAPVPTTTSAAAATADNERKKRRKNTNDEGDDEDDADDSMQKKPKKAQTTIEYDDFRNANNNVSTTIEFL